jgi:hypothetical protein
VNIIRIPPNKITQKQAEAIFAERGYKLIGTYENALKPIEFICPVNHVGAMTLANFKSGYGCYQCRNEKTKQRCKFSTEYVKKYFIDNGCEPLFDEYINANQKLKYKCTCGNIAEITFAKFKCGQRCRKCFMVRTWVQRDKTGSAIVTCGQKYLHESIGGILNYPCGSAMLDIAFLDNMIYVEYDGSGHWLSVKIGALTMEQFIKNERARTYKLYRAGWRAIRIITRNDKLPSKEELKNIIDDAKNKIISGAIFVEIDIDNNIIKYGKIEQPIVFGELRVVNSRRYGND